MERANAPYTEISTPYGHIRVDATPAGKVWEFCGARNSRECKLEQGYVLDPEMDCLATAPLPGGTFIFRCNALVAKK